MSVRAFLGLAVVLAGGAGLRAADDVDQPYHLRIVVQVGAHRLLTRDFRDALQRELRDEFRDVLGKLDKVEVRVIDLGSAPDDLGPLGKLVAEKNLGALDQATELTGIKTHFVQLDYTAGQYRLAARQYDGSTGLASPLVRTAYTPDRLSVGRLALRLLGQDFGAVGEVRDLAGDSARVELKGAKLGTPVNRLVRKGEVFALVRAGGAGSRGGRVPDTLLVVESDTVNPADGVCACRILTNRKQLPTPPGLRAIKLGTVTAPLRLQLNDNTGVPVTNVTVFAGPTDAAAQPLRVEGNLFVSAGPVAHYAWVRVTSGAVIIARYPIELLQDGVVVRTPELLTAGTEVKDLVQSWRDLLAQIVELRTTHAGNQRRIGDLMEARKNKEALEKARASVDYLKTRMKEIEDQRTILHADSQKINQEFPEDALCQKLLKELAESQKRATELAGDLQAAVSDESGRRDKASQVRSLVARANILREQAEFEQVIKLYEEILQIDPGQTKVKEDLERLKSEWGNRHPAAANFAYNIWPNQTTAQDIKAKLEAARQAFTLSQRKSDKLVPQKLLVVARTTLVSNLEQQARPLLNSPSEDDRKTLVLIRDVLKSLRDFEDQINTYLGSGK